MTIAMRPRKELDIHHSIRNRLATFRKTGRIPNIIFHGPSGGGKHTLVRRFVSEIYDDDQEVLKDHVMMTNCAHGKGIRFVREEVKFFAKTNVGAGTPGRFKTVVMTNADKLTVDAQSALRRCIEQFNSTTRFFIVVGDRHRLLKPIVSRFSDIHVPLPDIGGKRVNLHDFVRFDSDGIRAFERNRGRALRRRLGVGQQRDLKDIAAVATALYERGYSGLDIMGFVESCPGIPTGERYRLLLLMHKAKTEFRCESLFIFFVLGLLSVRSEDALENLLVM